MTDFSVPINEIKNQDYIGKEEILSMLEKANYVFKMDEDIQCQELADRYKRFIERDEDDTDHKCYLIEIFSKLVCELEKRSKDNCRVFSCLIEPYYSYGFYIHLESGNIIAVIRGYDIRKTPRDVKIKVWGEEPELLDISKLNVDGTLKK